MGNIKIESIKQIEWSIDNMDSFLQDADDLRMVDSSSFSLPDVDVDVIWHLKIWPFGREISMTLYCNTKRKYLVEYDFVLKKSDGSVEQLVGGILEEGGGIMKEEAGVCRKTKSLRLSEVLRRKSQLAPNSVLTVICRIKAMNELTNVAKSAASDKMETLKLINLDKLSENFKELFDDKESCDVTLKVMDKEYKAHRSVLIARSRVFAATFRHDTSERQTGIITIPDCNPDTFPEFLEYLYCGKLENISLRSALDLYYTSDKYDVQELKTFCDEYLKQCLTVENMCEVAVFADKYVESPLTCAVQEFFNRNVCRIFETFEWEQLLENNYRLANKLLKEMSNVNLKKK